MAETFDTVFDPLTQAAQQTGQSAIGCWQQDFNFFFK
jgi:hypothetical protein